MVIASEENVQGRLHNNTSDEGRWGGGVHGAEGNTPSALRRQVDIVCVSGAL